MRYDELVELACKFADNARLMKTKDIAGVLWKMAREYQEKAAELDSGKRPDIGPPPPFVE